MTTSISEWLERNTGDTKRQMALRLGQPPSTFNRNIETPEVIVAVCLAYNLNPVEALVEAGFIRLEDVIAYADAAEQLELFLRSTPDAIIERIQLQLDALAGALKEQRPLSGQLSLFLESPGHGAEDPDYSSMSEGDAKDYGLAAHKGEDNIGFDDMPHEP